MEIKKILLSAFLFVVVFNLLFFRTQIGIGTGILFLLLNLYLYFTKDESPKNLKLAISYSVIGTTFVFLLGFRGNEILEIINLFSAIFFTLTAFYFYKSNASFKYQIPKFLLLPFQVISQVIVNIPKSFNSRIDSEEQQPTSKAETASLVRGAVITIPIVAILLLLLTNADPVFAKYTQDLLKNLGERVVISLIIFFVLFFFGVTKIKEIIQEELLTEEKIDSHRVYELSIITGSIVTLFALFILVQTQYLFSNIGESELSKLGIQSLTYSEYVRKGFFELLIASGISSIVIIYILRIIKYLNQKRKFLIQILTSILTFEVGLLLLSAAQRLNLYASEHGLTRARIFGFIFLLWLVGILVIFLIRIYKEQSRKMVFIITLTITLITFLSLNWTSIDGLIATKYKPTVNDEIDYSYITSLSTDAVDSWKEAIMQADMQISNFKQKGNLGTEDNRKLSYDRMTIQQLDYKVNYLTDKYGPNPPLDQFGNVPPGVLKSRKWPSYNLSEYQAYLDIIQNKAIYDRIPLLLNDISILDTKISNEVRNNTQIDRSIDPPF